jgi:hypothetical protein
MVTTQLSLLGGVAPKTYVQRTKRPTVKPDVEKALVHLAPHLAADMEPKFHKGCVEIAVPPKHPVEKLLRRVGFAPNRHPFGWVKPAKTATSKQTAIAAPAAALRFWRLEYVR